MAIGRSRSKPCIPQGSSVDVHADCCDEVRVTGHVSWGERGTYVTRPSEKSPRGGSAHRIEYTCSVNGPGRRESGL